MNPPSIHLAGNSVKSPPDLVCALLRTYEYGFEAIFFIVFFSEERRSRVDFRVRILCLTCQWARLNQLHGHGPQDLWRKRGRSHKATFPWTPRCPPAKMCPCTSKCSPAKTCSPPEKWAWTSRCQPVITWPKSWGKKSGNYVKTSPRYYAVRVYFEPSIQ